MAVSPVSPVSPVWIGVDAGTSLAKAAAFDAAGGLVALATRPLPMTHPEPTWTEQDPELIAASVQDCLAEVAAAVDGRDVELIALTSQGDGCWLADHQGRPLRPGISWMDGRASSLVASWTADGICDKVFAENGNMIFPGASAAILAWLDQYEPDVLDRARTAGYVKDCLLQLFTGLRATDPTSASVPFGSLTGEVPYSGTVLELTGLTHRADLLAPVGEPLPFAPLTLDMSRRTGLPPDSTVVAAPYDTPACALGAGVRETGDGLLILGTTLACAVLQDSIDLSGQRAGLSVAMPDGRWLRLMAAMAGTASLDWTLGMLGVSFAQLDGLLAESPPGAHGVEVLPYLAPSGERAPFVDPAARAQFGGLSITTTRSDLIRGLCEGLAFAARSCFDAAGPAGKVYVCGGGSSSRSWLQLIASVLNRPVCPARAGQVGARGAVLSAAWALGRDVDPTTWVAPGTVIEPVATDVDLYDHRYHRFQAQLAAARELWLR